MEKDIIEIMMSRGLDKIHLEYLIGLGDEYDADGETYPISCNTLAIFDNEVYVYDDFMEHMDGYVFNCDRYGFCELDENKKNYVLWALHKTLEYLDNNESK